jgi:hypothetical protein
MIITANHNDLMVSLELATMRVGIHRNNVWLGSGKWSLRAGIVDCAAHLAERVYDALDDAMRDAIDAYVEDRVDDLRAEALTHNAPDGRTVRRRQARKRDRKRSLLQGFVCRRLDGGAG